MRIEVEVTNRAARLLGNNLPYEKLLPYWSYSHPSWHFMRRKFAHFDPDTGKTNYTWDGKVQLLTKDDELPVGLFWATRKSIEATHQIKFEVNGRLKAPEWKAEGNLFSSGEWEFQNPCVDRMVQTARFGGGLVVNATGSGKTRIAAMFFSRLKGCGLFVVDQLLLLNQAVKDMEKELGEEIGVVGNSIFKPKRITVATVQTMHRHKSDSRYQLWAEYIQAMMIDEIHEQMNHRNFDVVKAIRPKAVYGLTATLEMRKKPIRVRAWALAGPVIYEFPLVEGQKRGVLAKGVAIRVRVKNCINVAEQADIIREFGGDSKAWGHYYIENIVENLKRNRVIEEIVRKARGAGRYTMASVTRVEHLKQLADLLPDVPHRIMSGTFKGEHVHIKDRLKHQAKFEEGKVRVIIANVVMKKGISIKRMDVVVDGAASSNPNDPVQKFGRGIRLHDDKDGLLYFDISDYDPHNKYNYFAKSAVKRANALKRAGIPVHTFTWGEDGREDELWEFAERKLAELLDVTTPGVSG